MSRIILCMCSILGMMNNAFPEENASRNLKVNPETEKIEESITDIDSDDSLKEEVLNQKDNADIQNKLAEVVDEAYDSDLEVEEKSDFSELRPEPGWNRYSGDSARTIREWGHWWRYLFLDAAQEFNWILGLKLYIYPRNEVFRAIYVTGTYDPNTLAVLKHLIHKGDVVLDIGANFGYISLVMSKLAGEQGKVIAIEPSSRDFSRLVDNVSLNNLEENILPFQVAISNEEGPCKLQIAPEERSALNTLGSAFSYKGIVKAGVEDIIATTIDKFVEDQDIEQFEHIDFIKLDIEGSELKALLGAKQTIAKYRPIIMLGINKASLSLCDSELSEVLETLYELRYRIYRLVEEPEFKLELVSDISEIENGIVFCIHETIVPPRLEQPKKISILESIKAFFSN